jgi:hypothetical protein
MGNRFLVPSTTPGQQGGMSLLATASASGATTIQFTSIPGAYKNLYLVWNNVFKSTAATWFALRFNGDTGSNYRMTGIHNANGTLTQNNDTSAQTAIGNTQETAPIALTGTTNVFLTNSYGSMLIPEYSNTGIRKYVTYSSISDSRYPHIQQGIWNSTAAITQIDFVRNSTQTITGTMYLYGVK